MRVLSGSAVVLSLSALLPAVWCETTSLLAPDPDTSLLAPNPDVKVTTLPPPLPTSPSPLPYLDTSTDGTQGDIEWTLIDGNFNDNSGCYGTPNGGGTWIFTGAPKENTQEYCASDPALGAGECCTIVTYSPKVDNEILSFSVSAPTCTGGLEPADMDVLVKGGDSYINYSDLDTDWDFPLLWTPKTCSGNYCGLSHLGFCFSLKPSATTQPPTTQPPTTQPPTTEPPTTIPPPTTRRPSVGVTPSTPIIVGDPRFVGFNGERYTITGEPNAIYNLISDRNLQYHGRFITFGRTSRNPSGHLSNVTFIGEVSVKWHDPFTGAEHRFHLNAYDEEMKRQAETLLAEAQPGDKELSMYDRHLNATAMELLVSEYSRRSLLFLNFDGARIPLRLSLPSVLPTDKYASVPLVFTSTYDEQACNGPHACHVRARAGDTFVSLSGSTLPVTFYFSIVLSTHGEIYLNEKYEMNGAGLASIDDDDLINKKDEQARFTRRIHGLLGYTYRLSPAYANGNVNEMLIKSMTSHIDHVNHAHELQTQRLQKRHDAREPLRRHWQIGDEAAAALLEGSLEDYAPPQMFSDEFTFNQYVA